MPSSIPFGTNLRGLDAHKVDGMIKGVDHVSKYNKLAIVYRGSKIPVSCYEVEQDPITGEIVLKLSDRVGTVPPPPPRPEPFHRDPPPPPPPPPHHHHGPHHGSPPPPPPGPRKTRW